MKVRIFKKHILNAILPFLIPGLFGSCTEIAGQSEFEQEAFRVPANITRTTRLGEVTQQDSDDWRISPLYSQLVFIEPAFPNPTSGETLSLEVEISSTANLTSIQVYFINMITQRRYITVVPISPDSFFEVISINPRVFSNTGLLGDAEGLHRLLLFDAQGRLITYGDILVEL